MVGFKVTCAWDEEARVYYVEESNVPGLSAESDTVEGIRAILQNRIPELVRLNMPETHSHRQRDAEASWTAEIVLTAVHDPAMDSELKPARSSQA